jgi:hypothetical protein
LHPKARKTEELPIARRNASPFTMGSYHSTMPGGKEPLRVGLR